MKYPIAFGMDETAGRRDGETSFPCYAVPPSSRPVQSQINPVSWKHSVNHFSKGKKRSGNPVKPVKKNPKRIFNFSTLALPPHCSLRNRVPYFRTASAFTLVETALALLAIGIGLIGLFGLGRLALESSRESDNDRRCAQMADAVFETLRTVNEIYINEARTNSFANDYYWYTLWESSVGDAPQPLLQPLPDTLWRSDGHLLFPPAANMCTNNIAMVINGDTRPRPAYDPDHPSLANWNPYYDLYFADPQHVYRRLHRLQPTALQEVITVVLDIYPDGATQSSGKRVFTTTLSNTGGMQ